MPPPFTGYPKCGIFVAVFSSVPPTCRFTADPPRLGKKGRPLLPWKQSKFRQFNPTLCCSRDSSIIFEWMFFSTRKRDSTSKLSVF